MATFEPHVPYQRLDLYEYDESKITASIVSAVRVDLYAMTTIVNIDVTKINPFTYLVELFVGDDTGPDPAKVNYTWTGNIKVGILDKECYDNTADLELDEKKGLVKEEIVNLLAENHSSCFFVTAKVIPPPPEPDKGTVTNTITSEKQIEIG